MFIGYFTERPYQDPQSGYFGATGKPIMDLTVSNDIYDAELGADLYNRYLDEKIYAEEMGFDGLMLNEHHGTPFCMGGAMNVEASILARLTQRAKIVLLPTLSRCAKRKTPLSSVECSDNSQRCRGRW